MRTTCNPYMSSSSSSSSPLDLVKLPFSVLSSHSSAITHPSPITQSLPPSYSFPFCGSHPPRHPTLLILYSPRPSISLPTLLNLSTSTSPLFAISFTSSVSAGRCGFAGSSYPCKHPTALLARLRGKGHFISAVIPGHVERVLETISHR